MLVMDHGEIESTDTILQFSTFQEETRNKLTFLSLRIGKKTEMGYRRWLLEAEKQYSTTLVNGDELQDN